MRRGWAVVVVVFLASVTSAAASSSLSSHGGELESWLYNLTLELPAIEESLNGFDVSFRHGSCTKFEVGSVGAVGEEAAMNLSVHGLSVHCEGKWRYAAQNSLGFPSGKGGVTAEVGPPTSLSARGSIVMDSRKWPGSAVLEGCDLTVDVTKLRFSGPGLSTAILKLLQGFIADAVSRSLGDAVCGLVTPLVDVNLTGVITETNVKLQSALDEAQLARRDAAAYAASLRGEFVDWGPAPVLISKLGGCALSQGLTLRLEEEFTLQINGRNLTIGLEGANASFRDPQVSVMGNGSTEGSIRLDASLIDTKLALKLTVDKLTERFGLSAVLSEATVDLKAQLAVEREPLYSTALGSWAESPLACGAQATAAANATSLDLKAQNYALKIYSSKDGLEAGLDEVLTVVLQLVLEGFPDYTDAVIAVGAEAVITRSNAAIGNLLHSSAGECKPAAVAPGMVHLNESSVLSAISRVDAGLVDWAVGCLFDEGSISSHGVVAGVRGLDTWSNLSTVAISIDETKSYATLSDLGLSLQGGTKNHASRSDGSWGLGLAMRDLRARWTLELPIARQPLAQLTLGQMQDPCFDLLGTVLARPPRISEASLKALPYNKSWFVVQGFGEDDAPLKEFLDELVDWSSQWPSLHRETSSAFVNRALESIFKQQKKMSKECRERHHCTNTKATTKQQPCKHDFWDRGLWYRVGVSALILIGSMAAAVLLVRYTRRRRKRSTGRRLADDFEAALLDDNLLEATPVQDDEEAVLPALAWSPALPLAARIAMPSLILINVALFAWSNATSAATVNLEVEALSEAGLSERLKYDFGSLFEFSLSNSVHDMWAAGVYPLSILIAACSGAWPYLKLLCMLLCWLLPTGNSPNWTILSSSRRESILSWVDALGKFSLVDTFVMILMMVAFHIDLTIGTDDAPLKKALLIHVFVEALPSFYVFVVASCLSLLLGHLILAAHRADEAHNTSVVAEAAPLQRSTSEYSTSSMLSLAETECFPSARTEPEEDEPAALCDHAFTEWKCWRAEKEYFEDEPLRSRCSSGFRFGLVALLLVSLVLLLFGLRMDSFDFLIRGAAGWVMGDEQREHLSVVSLGLKLPAASKKSALALQIVYFVYGVGLPIAQIPLLLAMWLVPLRLASTQRCLVACEVASAWAAMDVFMLAVLAAMTEISQFAAFMVGDRCDEINILLEALLPDQTQGKCFDVRTKLDRGCWLLFTSAVISTTAANVIMRLAKTAIRDRQGKQMGHSRSSFRGQILPSAPDSDALISNDAATETF